MAREISLLTKILICNTFGINEARFSNDRKKKNRALSQLLVWGLLIFVLLSNVIGVSGTLCLVGAAKTIPLLLFTLASVVILFFSFFKAGSVIFQMKSYELLVSFPVKSSSIVISRFLSMYLSDLLLSALVIFPGLFVYAMNVGAGALQIVMAVIGVIFLPLIPITLSTAVGAGIAAIGARMKHKSIVGSALTVLFACGAIAFSYLAPNTVEDFEAMGEGAMMKLVTGIESSVRGVWIPAGWYSDAVNDGNVYGLLLLVLVSVLIFAVLMLILQRFFLSICTAINATGAKNNFKLRELKSSGRVTALWHREIKRYFASSIYVSNTVVAYVLVVVFSVAVLIIGPLKVEESIGMTGIVARAYPILIAAMAAMLPTTAVSVSMEGKQWWIAQSLPVEIKDIWKSKILVNFIIVAPFYLVSTVIGIIAFRETPEVIPWLITVPAAYIIFSSVSGLAINLAFPLLEWESEVRAVKQGTSVVLSMLVEVGAAGLSIAAVLLLGFVPMFVIMPILIVLLLTVAAVMFRGICKKDIRNIG